MKPHQKSERGRNRQHAWREANLSLMQRHKIVDLLPPRTPHGTWNFNPHAFYQSLGVGVGL